MGNLLRSCILRQQSAHLYVCVFLVASHVFVLSFDQPCAKFLVQSIYPGCRRFQNFEGCENQLEVHCTQNGGYIQTPKWDKLVPYRANTNSCVSLHAPESHVTMVSLVSADMHRDVAGSCRDTLELFKMGNCSGNSFRSICYYWDFAPTVFTDTGVLSFKFRTDGSIQKTGFRLLYSFHNSSEAPRQLPGGQWDCDVPYYGSFYQHFVCLGNTFCSDKRDRAQCAESDLCGHGMLRSGDRCYRFFPAHWTSWLLAHETCRKLDAYLPVMSTAEDRRIVTAVIDGIRTKYYMHEPIFAGLTRDMAATSEIYRTAWFGADETLATYLNITYKQVASPYCTLFNGTSLIMATCEDTTAAILCTFNARSDQPRNVTSISLATPSGWGTETMTTCRYEDVTHTFLACDVSTNCSAWTYEESVACSEGLSPPAPFFTCSNNVGRVPYTLVCDFRLDCCDGSDEDFCDVSECASTDVYECSDSRQCIPGQRVCDMRTDCVDGSDEMMCWYSFKPYGLVSNTVLPPALIDFTGFGNFTAKPISGDTCPETHFQCPGDGYCMPVYVRCNEVDDCPGEEDEKDCDQYTCPGFYRCRGSKICLHEQHLCDDVFQCPEHDDELMCNFTCPDTCHCYGHAFVCTGVFTADNFPELRYVDADGTGMKPEDFLQNTKIIYLRLSNCGITDFSQLNFPNLQTLDLSHNDILEINRNQFQNLRKLVFLSLAYNVRMSFNSLLDARLRLPNVLYVNFSGIAIPELEDEFMKTFPNIKYLNMSGTGLKKAHEGFGAWNGLRRLDLRGCPIEPLFPELFKDLNQLDTIYADDYKLCCPAILPQGMDSKDCHAPSDDVSSCDDLLESNSYRVFIALYAMLILTGNLGSFVYQVCFFARAVTAGFGIFMTHLFVSDFLLGISLCIIGIADSLFRGNYLWNDVAWRNSVGCKLAGFLSLASNEVSVCLVGLITVERLVVVCFPLKNLRFNHLSAHAVSSVAWLVGLILALVPLMPIGSPWHFYGHSSICISLPLSRERLRGSDYALSVTAMNVAMSLFIAVGQILIHRSIRVNAAGLNDSGNNSRDMLIAQKLRALVLINILCWFFIGLLGLVIYTGAPVSSKVTTKMTVFLLPLKSALDPFLYTFRVARKQRHNIPNLESRKDKKGATSAQNSSQVSDVEMDARRKKENYSQEEACELFIRFLDEGLLTPDQVRQHMIGVTDGKN